MRNLKTRDFFRPYQYAGRDMGQIAQYQTKTPVKRMLSWLVTITTELCILIKI